MTASLCLMRLSGVEECLLSSAHGKGRYRCRWVEPAIVVGQKWWNVGSSTGFHTVLQLTPFTVCLLLSARPE